jgi:hypothetical protein
MITAEGAREQPVAAIERLVAMEKESVKKLIAAATLEGHMHVVVDELQGATRAQLLKLGYDLSYTLDGETRISWEAKS